MIFVCPSHCHTHQVINPKKKGSKELSDEEKQKQMMSFIDKYEKEIKSFGMLGDYGSR